MNKDKALSIARLINSDFEDTRKVSIRNRPDVLGYELTSYTSERMMCATATVCINLNWSDKTVSCTHCFDEDGTQDIFESTKDTIRKNVNLNNFTLI